MIVFSKVSYKNFLSAGNVPIVIELDRRPTTLITGPNGAGKSAGVIDAIYFALYGKAYRKLKKDQIVNAINKKNALVELEFSTDNKTYKVIRGISPGVFEIYVDGKLKEQDASIKDYQDWLVDSVLKMNATTMKQIVFLGSTSFVPFMRLSTGERRKVIEEILDIQIFSTMNQLVKSKASSLSILYSDAQSEIKLIMSKIKLLEKHSAEIATHKDEAIKKNLEQIRLSKIEYKKLSKKISEISPRISELKESIADADKVQSQISDIRGIIRSLEVNEARFKSSIEFFEDNTDCPTCGQDIDEDFRKAAVDATEKKLVANSDGISKARAMVEDFSRRMEEILEIQDEISNLSTELAALTARKDTIEQHQVKLVESNEELANETVIRSKDSPDSEIVTLTESMNKHISNRDGVAEKVKYYTLISGLLKDNGIKSKIIRSYLPTINSLIRKYLEILEFNCEFSFNENFEETIKSRYRDNFSYANFSEGQKMRIDLALLFTWRELANIRNSASTNLLVLDEIGSSSLDSEGTSSFMRIITQTSDKSNVFVISHDSTIMDQFSSIIEYELVDNFSRIK